MTTGPQSAAAARRLMRQIREIMAGRAPAQERLDRLAKVIAANLIGDVCSIYLSRAGGWLELSATEGLSPEAVHQTRMGPGEGLVGQVALTAQPLNVQDAPNHPAFSYHPETQEEGIVSFLGVPILRGGRLLGVLTVQNRTPRLYDEEELETLQTAAMVVAEVMIDPSIGADPGLAGLELRPSRTERLVGRRVADGVAIGTAVKIEPHVRSGRLFADDPEAEVARVEAAIHRLREGLDAILQGDAARIGGQPREVIETYLMFANDRGWLERLKEAARLGLTAEAAVERVRNEQRARMLKASDPYLRDRLHDLEDLANRLLRHLGEEDGASENGVEVPDDAILIARSIGPAELLERDPDKVKGLVLEEGSPASHAAVVARALGAPAVGQLTAVLDRVENGDVVIVDGERGEVHLRPTQDLLDAYRARIALTGAREAEFERIKDRPAVTKDDRRIALLMNAGLLIDLPQLDRTGAEGIGLFRTEFQFMIAEALPKQDEQIELYRAALDAAGDRPVIFRTLDLGGDKILPYAPSDREENPAMGWRAVRLALDRPGLLRYQLRALIAAAGGRELDVMFPLVTTPEEFAAARGFVDMELEWARRRGRTGPERVRVGAMLEAPSLAFQLDALLDLADFISIGANDLLQFLFAADRQNPKMGDRYDSLAPSALALLKQVRDACARRGRPVSVCGEIAGRPLEAMALIALGYERLSMPPVGIGPVKRMVLGLDAGAAAERVLPLLASPKASVRPEIEAVARDLGVPIEP